ncbi:hypothetical protein [Nocardia sp. NBC_00403]
MTVGGYVARIMVREWVDIAFISKTHDVVDHDTNILCCHQFR